MIADAAALSAFPGSSKGMKTSLSQTFVHCSYDEYEILCRINRKRKLVDAKVGQNELNQAKSKDFLAKESISDSPNLAFRGCRFRDYFKKNCVYRGI